MEKENKFYVVKSTIIPYDKYILFNSLPRKVPNYFRNIGYYDNEVWTSLHGYCYLNDKAALKFKDINHDSKPVPVMLVKNTMDEEPDFYVQRVGENLYIDNHLTEYWRPETRRFLKLFKIKKWIKDYVVYHDHRISNKLFDWLKESDGIVGFNIVRLIDNRK